MEKEIMSPERYLELKKRNPDMSEITGPILAREYEKDLRMDLARKILSGEYEIKSSFQGWPDGDFQYEITTKNGNVRFATQEFKNGYVICIAKKESEPKEI